MKVPVLSLVVGAVMASVVVVTGGCGGDSLSLVEVTGTVTYRGKPVPNANITLHPSEGPPATATSDDQGNFSLNTAGQPGVVPGSAKVAITAFEELKSIAPSEEHPEGVSELRSLIPEKYSLIASTPIQVEVAGSDANHFDWELTD